MARTKTPIVAIVGRTNVGKSSLFNRVLGQRRAVVADEPGTTRDRVQARINLRKNSFILVDTAGLKDPEDEFESTIQDQIYEATETADAIIVMVDASTIITEEDRRIAKLALKSNKPVALAVNKIDKAKGEVPETWLKTGIKDIFGISALHNEGIEELFEYISSVLPIVKPRVDSIDLSIALIGRPNVGKSYLFNTLGKKQQARTNILPEKLEGRAIVSDVAGTTRDVNVLNIKYHSQSIELLDTAGIRRPGRIEQGVERFSIVRTVKAIDYSDVCLLVIDVNELSTHMDQKIAGQIKDAGKGLIITVSKWDSIEKDSFTRDELAPKISYAFQHVWWAPLIFTSAVTGQNVSKIYDLALDIKSKRKQKLKTPELNNFLQSLLAKHPPAGLKNRHPKLNYITQTDVNPPTFTIFGSQTKFLHWSYKRYLEKEMRLKWDFTGTPIRLVFKEKDKK